MSDYTRNHSGRNTNALRKRKPYKSQHKATAQISGQKLKAFRIIEGLSQEELDDPEGF